MIERAAGYWSAHAPGEAVSVAEPACDALASTVSGPAEKSHPSLRSGTIAPMRRRGLAGGSTVTVVVADATGDPAGALMSTTAMGYVPGGTGPPPTSRPSQVALKRSR